MVGIQRQRLLAGHLRVEISLGPHMPEAGLIERRRVVAAEPAGSVAGWFAGGVHRPCPVTASAASSVRTRSITSV